MLLPSISTLLAGIGVTGILFVANWVVWSLPQTRNFHVDPKAIFLAGPPTAADLYLASAGDPDDFKKVA